MTHPAISSLNRQLAAKGEAVILRRPVPNGQPVDVAVQAFVRGYRPEELVGGITQGDSAVVLSPSEIEAAGWPAPIRQNDKIIAQGRTRNIQASAPVVINGETVRYDLQVRG